MTSKPKLNQPDVESTITSPIGESLNINFTIPSKQFEQVFEKDTNIEKRNLTLEAVKKEWEELGYVWKETNKWILLDNNIEEKTIRIYKSFKLYHVKALGENYFEIVSFALHQLLTKTFKALGWEK